MASQTEKINHPHIIFCEGVDEQKFLIYYLNSPELKEHPFLSEDVQIIDFGGNEELSNKLEVLKITPGFSSAKSLLIIRDAEKDPKAAVCQIQSSLEKTCLPMPLGPGEWKSNDSNFKTGFLLFPSCDKTVCKGTLEDLCLSILNQPDVSDMVKEIQEFLIHLKQKTHREFPHEHKTKLHTYFSITDKFIGLKIGEAAQAQAFDWNSEKLHFLKSFLAEMEI